MTKTDRRRFVNECMQGMRRDLLKIADTAPEHWNGHQLRAALKIVAQRYDTQPDRKAQRRHNNEVHAFLYNHNL